MTYTLPNPAMVHVDAQMYSTPCFTGNQLLEAYAAGQRDMREAAAEVIDDINRRRTVSLDDCIEAIRALPIETI